MSSTKNKSNIDTNTTNCKDDKISDDKQNSNNNTSSNEQLLKNTATKNPRPSSSCEELNKSVDGKSLATNGKQTEKAKEQHKPDMSRRNSSEVKQTNSNRRGSRPVSRNNSIEIKSSVNKNNNNNNNNNNNKNNNNKTPVKKPVIKRPLSMCDDKKINGVKHNKSSSLDPAVTAGSSEEDLLSMSLPTNGFSTETSPSDSIRRPSTGSALTRIGLQDASVESVVTKHKTDNYVTKGFRLVTYKTLNHKNMKTSEVIQSATNLYENLIHLQLFLLCEGVSVTTSSTSKADTLPNLCEAMNCGTLKIPNNVYDVILEAAKESAKILQNHFIQDKIELKHSVTTDNKFSLHGMVNCIISGKDFLGSKHKNMVQFKVCTEKNIPSNFILEIFLYAAIMDLPTAYLLVFHAKELTVALYEFKFKFDQLREFNRGTTRKLICDNFYRNIYQHADYKVTFKERKELKL